MLTIAGKRLMRHFKRLQEDPPDGVSCAPTDNNLFQWNAIIVGPRDSPFEGGTFKLILEFPEDFPLNPPTVRFVSKMFHPNVYSDGSIDLDIALQTRWRPALDVTVILISVQCLLGEPNLNSPANNEAAKLYRENRREYEEKVAAIVQESLNDVDEDNDDNT